MEEVSGSIPAPLRSLGPLEKYSAVRNNLDIYLNVCVTATYKWKSTEALKPAIFRALAAVITQHPILSAIPVEEHTATPHFIRVPQIFLEKIVTFSKQKSSSGNPAEDPILDKILEAEHNRPFRHETPLLPYWRVNILEGWTDMSSFTFCFSFHHSLFDTKSALVFLKDFENVLSHPSNLPAPTTIPALDVPLLPCMESIYDLPVSQQFLALQDKAALSETPPPTSTWSGSPQTMPVRTRFRSHRLPAGTTAALQASARAHGATVTAALMALLAAAFFHALPPRYTALHADCAVSLRRFLPAPVTDRSMGCYVGWFGETYTRRPPPASSSSSSSSWWPSIWAEARRTKETIDEKVVRGRGADTVVGYLQHVPDMAAWFLGKIGKKRTAAFELSNVGVLEPRDAGVRGGGDEICRGEGGERCLINGLVFSQSAGATSAAVKVSAVTGRDGRLTLGFSWQEGVVEDSVVEGVIAKVSELAEMVDDS